MGYRQSLELDHLDAEEWIFQADFVKLMVADAKDDEAWIQHRKNGGDLSETRRKYYENRARQAEEVNQRYEQNDEHFQRRVAEDRTRHLINPDGEFTPENDADYQADIKQIKLEFEQRMTWVNDWEKHERPEHTDARAKQLRRGAKELQEQAMKYAYERHDLRKGGWSDRAAYHKRELVIRRQQVIKKDNTVQRLEEAYARERKMPTDAQQRAGFPTPPSSPSSSSTHQLSLLPALEHRLLHTAHSSVHQFQHSVKTLAPAFYGWEKRFSGSQVPGVQKVPLEAELKAVSHW
ncbi:MAG: hypothetical protein M1826_006603 [Phylliscum demangeonii]|nr:MAG: hypothetical protein M1826_006603 [Phylliscum demangeonii]